MREQEFFVRFARGVSAAMGHPATFCTAAGLVLLWLIVGPAFGFSDTWQLTANTIATMVTFLMVFVIQSSQNRESVAVQLKLDELIRALEGAHTRLVALEDVSDEELRQIRDSYR